MIFGCAKWLNLPFILQLQLQTLNDMTRSMTAPLVHIKKLAKASNMKVGLIKLISTKSCLQGCFQASAVLPSTGEEVVLNEGPKNPTHHRFLSSSSWTYDGLVLIGCWVFSLGPTILKTTAFHTDIYRGLRFHYL